MPLVVKDRVRETTTTTGTGTITLAGAIAGFQSFSAIGNANTTYYTINLPGANEWEVGLGTYTASGTTLSRDTILASSNSGSAVNFSAGTKDVFCTYPAGRSVYYDTSTNVSINNTLDTTNVEVTNIRAKDGTAAIVLTDSTGAVSISTNLTIGDASGDTLTINGTAVSTPNGLNFDSDTLVIDAANNRVGVGIASPTTLLDVRDGVGSILTLGNIGTFIAGESSYLKFREASTALAEVGWEADFNELRINNRVAFTSFYVANTEKMRLASATGGVGALGIGYTSLTSVGDSGLAVLGNVGIGTNAPTTKLYVTASVASTAIAGFFNTDTANGNGVYIKAGGANAGKYALAVDNAASASLLYLESSGNLGIGTSTPAGVLNIKTSNGQFLVQNGTSAAQMRISAFNNAGNANAALIFEGYASEYGRFDASGNLGLGVTPSDWNANNKVFQLTNNASLFSRSGLTGVAQNFRYNASDVGIFMSAGYATLYYQNAGSHIWTVSTTSWNGTGSDTASLSQVMTLDASGRLLVGTTSNFGGAGQFAIDQGGGTTPVGHLIGTAGVGGGQRTVGLNFSGVINDTGPAYGTLAQVGAGKENATQGNTAGYLSFATIPNGGSLTERARITSGGDLLVGSATTATSSSAGFKVLGSLVSGHWDPTVVTDSNSASASCWDIYSTATSSYRFYVTTTGVINAVNTTISAISDVRFKENIQDLDVGLDKIMALKPRKFDWKTGKGKDIKGDRGWIAQEFEQVFPDMIDTWRDPAPEGEEPYKAVRADLIPVLVKAIQEQQAMINELKAEVAALKGA
jgi:hypothetical protein